MDAFYHQASIEFLQGLIHNYELSISTSHAKDRETLIGLLDQVFPLTWMEQCTQFLQEVGSENPINRYLNNMFLQKKIETDQLLTQEEMSLIKHQLTRAIVDQLPKPVKPFNTYGITDSSVELKLGTTFTIMIPMSCSLDINVTTATYKERLLDIPFEGELPLPFRIVDIVVPHDANVAYHATHSQVIFPTGSRFAVFKTGLMKTWYVWGHYVKIETARLLYIGII